MSCKLINYIVDIRVICVHKTLTLWNIIDNIGMADPKKNQNELPVFGKQNCFEKQKFCFGQYSKLNETSRSLFTEELP